jgi:hypothetical protein
VAGDRFTDPTQIEFGSVMDERLKANSATNVNWSSRKSLEGTWLVSVDYLLRGAKGIATWSFDPKNLVLVPESQSALQLSNSVALTISEDKLEKTEHFHPTSNLSIPQATEEAATTTALSVVPELVELQVIETETRTELISVVDSEMKFFHIVEDNYEGTSEEEGLPERDEPHKETEAATEIVEDVIETEAQKVAEEPFTPSKNQSTSRWAEVLFGSKDEDEQ